MPEQGVDLVEWTTHLVPTFRSSCYISAGTFHELRKVMGYSQTYDSSTAFLFDAPGSNLPHVVQERQTGSTRRPTTSVEHEPVHLKTGFPAVNAEQA